MLKKCFLIGTMACLLTGCSLKKEEVNKIQPSDNVLVLKTTEIQEYDGDLDDELEDLYLKYEGEKVQDPVKSINGWYKYVNGKKSVLIINKNNELTKIDKNGNEEIIASNMESYPDIEVSNDGEIIVFQNNDGNLFIKKGNEEKVKIDDNVSYFDMSEDGKYIYYADGDDKFYVYSGTTSENLDNEIYNRQISDNGKNVAFKKYNDRLYLKLSNKAEVEEVVSSDKNIYDYEVYDDGSVLYKLQEYTDENGELFLYKDNDKELITKVAKEYFKKENIIYYIDSNGNLYERNIKEDEPKKLLSKICYFAEVNDGIVVIDKNGEIYMKNSTCDLTQIGKTDKIEDEYYIGNMKIVNGNDIVYLNKDGSLYMNSKKIADNVSDFTCNSQNIAYVTNDRKAYIYNTKKDSSKLELDNLENYTVLCFEDETFYYNTMKINDLVGFWKVSSDNFIYEFRGNDILLEYYKNGERYYYTFEVFRASNNYISLATDKDDYIGIRKLQNNKLEISINNITYEAISVDKKEADKIIKLGIKNKKSQAENEVYEEIKTLMENYISDYVDAVNEDDFYRIEDYLIYEGPLYNEQYKNVTGFYEKGISEELYSSEIISLEKNDSGDFKVKTLDKIGIIKDGEETIKDFEQTYIIKEVDGQYLINEML